LHRHHAVPGLVLAKGVNEEDALEFVASGLAFYKDHGGKRERLGSMVCRLGGAAVFAALA